MLLQSQDTALQDLFFLFSAFFGSVVRAGPRIGGTLVDAFHLPFLFSSNMAQGGLAQQHHVSMAATVLHHICSQGLSVAGLFVSPPRAVTMGDNFNTERCFSQITEIVALGSQDIEKAFYDAQDTQHWSNMRRPARLAVGTTSLLSQVVSRSFLRVLSTRQQRIILRNSLANAVAATFSDLGKRKWPEGGLVQESPFSKLQRASYLANKRHSRPPQCIAFNMVVSEDSDIFFDAEQSLDDGMSCTNMLSSLWAGPSYVGISAVNLKRKLPHIIEEWQRVKRGRFTSESAQLQENDGSRFINSTDTTSPPLGVLRAVVPQQRPSEA